MKTYKFLTIRQLGDGWEYSEKLTNEWVKLGWTIEHVSPTNNGEILLLLSKEEQPDVCMICD